jgi:hypothetical protein
MRVILLLLLIISLAIPAEARATVRRAIHHSSGRIVVHRAVPHRVQQHVSFLQAVQPLKMPEETTLTGHVEHQTAMQSAPVLPTISPTLPVIARPTEFSETALPRTRITRKQQHPIQERAWVSDITSAQAGQIAQTIVEFATAHFPPAETTLVLAPTKRHQRKNVLTPVLSQQLRQSGFALANNLEPRSHILQYQVHRLDDGLLVRVRIGKHQAARYFQSATFHTLSAAPLTTIQPGEPQ